MPKIPKIDKGLIIRRFARDMQSPTVEPTKGIIEGYPIVFNERTAIGDYFFEEIDPHALDEADLSDVKFMVNHNDGMIPLARHRRGKRSTMDIAIDERGMHIQTTLDVENNSTARELCSAVQRGDIEDMSFAFGIMVSGEDWRDLDKDMPTRRITKISKVCEVSAANEAKQTASDAANLASTTKTQVEQKVNDLEQQIGTKQGTTVTLNGTPQATFEGGGLIDENDTIIFSGGEA